MAEKNTKNIAETTDVDNTSVEKTAVKKQTKSKQNTSKVSVEKETVETIVEPLKDSDEIEVVSLIPNVSYEDAKTGDMYVWDTVGQKEYLTVETLKNMWRRYKSYFKNMWLRPKDDRVIKLFGLKNHYSKFDFLMDKSSYSKKNIPAIEKALASSPNGLRRAVCDKVKNLVINEEISDVAVIRTLETNLDLDLVSLL